MKSKRIRRLSKKNKKGGFFSPSKPNDSPECNPNDLSMIKGSDALHDNYQKCCPKGMFGTKNSSPYCKQVDLNFQAALKGENDANEYHGYEPDEEAQMKQNDNQSQPVAEIPKSQYDVAVAQKKAWYKFWGGRKSRRANKKHSRKHKKHSRKHKK
jgi:hypothetical protein